MPHRMLIPLDGSLHSKKVLEIAAPLATANGSEVTLMHVVPRATVPEDFARYLEVEHLKTPPAALYEETLGEEALAHFASEARDLGITVTTTHATAGEAATEILGYAASSRADMIVMGTHGAGAFAGLLLGSVAQRVAHRAECTVILVR